MYYFIVNPKSSSGKGIQYWRIVKKELEARQISYNVSYTKYQGHATEIAEIISRRPGIKQVIILGGDGTVNEVVNGIVNFDQVLLGYIPSGSSNDLARSLNIPKDPIKALDNIINPTRFKYLDLGIINFLDQDLAQKKFCCSSGIGYDANVCVEVQASSLKKKLNRYGAGKLIYLAIAIKQIIGIKSVDGTVIIDGVRKASYKNILTICNMIHKYEGGGLLMAPFANPSDGKLSICLVHGMNRFKIFTLLPTLVIGKHINFRGVEAFNCSSIEINTSRILAVHTDGEVPTFSSHIKVKCVPGQIRMIL